MATKSFSFIVHIFPFIEKIKKMYCYTTSKVNGKNNFMDCNVLHLAAHSIDQERLVSLAYRTNSIVNLYCERKSRFFSSHKDHVTERDVYVNNPTNNPLVLDTAKSAAKELCKVAKELILVLRDWILTEDALEKVRSLCQDKIQEEALENISECVKLLEKLVDEFSYFDAIHGIRDYDGNKLCEPYFNTFSNLKGYTDKIEDCKFRLIGKIAENILDHFVVGTNRITSFLVKYKAKSGYQNSFEKVLNVVRESPLAFYGNRGENLS